MMEKSDASPAVTVQTVVYFFVFLFFIFCTYLQAAEGAGMHITKKESQSQEGCWLFSVYGLREGYPE